MAGQKSKYALSKANFCTIKGMQQLGPQARQPQWQQMAKKQNKPQPQQQRRRNAKANSHQAPQHIAAFANGQQSKFLLATKSNNTLPKGKRQNKLQAKKMQHSATKAKTHQAEHKRVAAQHMAIANNKQTATKAMHKAGAGIKHAKQAAQQ
ncbi:hypothetical protein Tco_0893690 [Tanacetum coccineum]|uniref:Uncharacterized protein n=1 Tax=Tanacetum coccineum TaxID=301880 RepID=A0ABQ5CAW5_9ASTR